MNVHHYSLSLQKKTLLMRKEQRQMCVSHFSLSYMSYLNIISNQNEHYNCKLFGSNTDVGYTLSSSNRVYLLYTLERTV